MKRNLVISAGHSITPGEDNGAQSVLGQRRYSEAHLAYQVVKDLYPILLNSGAKVYVDDYGNFLKETLASLRKLFGSVIRKDTLAVEVHFNASSSPKANGTEVVVPDGATEYEKLAARRLTSAISTALGTRSRGVISEAQTYRKKLGWMRIPCETVLLEICFITSPEDMERYETNYRRMIDALAREIIDLLKS